MTQLSPFRRVVALRPFPAASMHNRIKNTLIALFSAVALGASTGCISSVETVTSDVSRVKVAFATDKAGRVFYETLTRASETRPRTEKRTEVNLILVEVERRTVAGPNKLFNEAVQFADTDRDGIITEVEAEIFADAWPLGHR